MEIKVLSVPYFEGLFFAFSRVKAFKDSLSSLLKISIIASGQAIAQNEQQSMRSRYKLVDLLTIALPIYISVHQMHALSL